MEKNIEIGSGSAEVSDEKWLLQEYIWARTKVEELDAELIEAKAKLEKAQSELHDCLLERGASKTAVYDDLGSYSIKSPTIIASVKNEFQEQLFEYLKSQDRSDLIKPTVHWKTLSSFVGEVLEEGKSLPEFITVYRKPSGIFYSKK
jgi:hypothetical protein